MRAVIAGLCLAVGACSSPRPGADEVDLNAAASAAQEDIDRYAAARSRPPRPARTPPAAPRSIDPAGDVGSTAAARGVVERYYALMAAGRAVDAWRLWGHGGLDCGQSATAFAAALTALPPLRATIGAPEDGDAGAGQRYVTVPVLVRAATGGEAARTLTLHRVADGIDTVDAAAHRWQIARETAAAGAPPPPMILPCAPQAG